MSPTGGQDPPRTRSRSLSAEPKDAKIRKTNHVNQPPSIPGKRVLITVPTSNMYDQLSDNVVDDNTLHNSNAVARSPPIIVFNQKITDLTALIQEVIPDPRDIRIRLTQHGTKVFTGSPGDFGKLKAHLKSKNVNYYTHASAADRMTKFVVYGLLESTDLAQIKFALASASLNPADIKKLSVKNPRYKDQATFLIYFKREDKVSLQKLQQVKAIDHLIVNFRSYSRNFVGPTQCSNCLHFGHGKKNCNLTPRCIRCGEKHSASNCQLVINKKDPKSTIPKEKVKCANCGGGHTANFSRCPARLNFVTMKQAVQKSKPQKPHVATVSNQQFSKQTRPENSWADIVARPRPSPCSPNSQLSPEECLEVFDYFVTLCDQGLTIQQQIRAIAQFTFTFMYNRTHNHDSR